MENVIKVEDLTMAYESKPVIWDIDLEIPKGVIMAIVGPNGAGKSTLMKGILNLLKPLSGKIEILHRPYKEVYKKIAYVPQSGSVNWDFPTTVLDVVMMGRYVHLGWIKRVGKKERELAMKALKEIEMDEFYDRQISQLSGGQRQRVFLARALIQEAEIYFLDEPMQGIDIKSEELIFKLLHKIKEQGKTIVVVHHDLKNITKYFDYVTLINKKIIASGPVETTFTEENIEKAYRGTSND